MLMLMLISTNEEMAAAPFAKGIAAIVGKLASQRIYPNYLLTYSTMKHDM